MSCTKDYHCKAYPALQSRVKELEAENAELKKCPNEAWECSKEQRRVEAENARLRKVVEAARTLSGKYQFSGRDLAPILDALRDLDGSNSDHGEKECPDCTLLKTRCGFHGNK